MPRLKGSADLLEYRRQRALAMLKTGLSFNEVGRRIECAASSVMRWFNAWRSVVRRFLVTCLGDADAIFAGLYAHLRELGWVGAHTVVVVVGDGAEWIWNRATMFVRRCEILDFWHALLERCTMSSPG